VGGHDGDGGQPGDWGERGDGAERDADGGNVYHRNRGGAGGVEYYGDGERRDERDGGVHGERGAGIDHGDERDAAGRGVLHGVCAAGGDGEGRGGVSGGGCGGDVSGAGGRLGVPVRGELVAGECAGQEACDTEARATSGRAAAAEHRGAKLQRDCDDGWERGGDGMVRGGAGGGRVHGDGKSGRSGGAGDFQPDEHVSGADVEYG